MLGRELKCRKNGSIPSRLGSVGSSTFGIGSNYPWVPRDASGSGRFSVSYILDP